MALIPSGKNSFILNPASKEPAEPIFDDTAGAPEDIQSLD
jgi:hypothetical protein